MTREAFRELVKKGPVLLDGATGTNLQKAGMPVGVCPEQWILENSEVLIDLQKRHVEAVSYTHLDVYKRQENTVFWHIQQVSTEHIRIW